MKVAIRFRLFWIVLIACAVLMGCSTFSEMNEDAAKAKSAIEVEFGGEIQIGWNIENGRITSVDVVFVKPPTGEISLAQLKQRVTELVNNNFRRAVQRVVVSM
jgi:uncharacterized protein YceK